MYYQYRLSLKIIDFIKSQIYHLLVIADSHLLNLYDFALSIPVYWKLGEKNSFLVQLCGSMNFDRMSVVTIFTFFSV